MTKKNINVVICALSHLYSLQANDFPTRREYVAAKNTRIKEYRNQLLAQALGIEPNQLQLKIAAEGKPYLQDHALYFNHSHSQDDYTIAYSFEVADIGIDIESLDRSIRFDALAKHAFHNKEYQRWIQSQQDTKYWFKVWTIKEAVLKAHGMGIRIELNSLDTQLDNQQNSGFIQDERLGQFYYQCFELEQAIMTVAWRAIEGSSQNPTIQITQHKV